MHWNSLDSKIGLRGQGGRGVSLSKIDQVRGVDPHQSPQKVLADLCQVLLETQMKLAEVNNEVIKLRSELDELKRGVR
jgi:hypothetical protein